MSTGRIELSYALPLGGFALDVALELPLRGVTGVFGASGSGKTTLLRCIAGLESPDRGRLVVDGDVWQDDQRRIGKPVHERQLGYVFQEPRLFSHLSVRRNLDYGARRRPPDTVTVGFDQVVDLLGLEALLERRTEALSGGEAQRVAIGRALLRGPRFVLMDEPLASLDRARRDEVLPFFDRLHAELAVPIVYVSHSIDEICRLCDHLVVMENGRAVADGDLQTVLANEELPMLAGEEVGSVIETTIVDVDGADEITRLRFSGGDLLVAGRAGASGDPLRLRVRANDVSLVRQRPAQTTILNVLPVVIEDIRDVDGAMVHVRVKAGSDRLLARITRRSSRQLGLGVGDEVFAQIKSAAIRSSAAP